jgi:hypothetical protein
MKKSNVAIGIICTLHIVLFEFAATAKLPDYYNFQFGLTETSIISYCVIILAWGISPQHQKRRTSPNIPASA